MKRLLTVALAALVLTGCAQQSNPLESDTKVTIGIGGQPLLVYLPTTLADRLGYYRDEGLQVNLQDLKSGSNAVQAVQGGSVDVASGYYDHTVQLQAKGRRVTSFVTMGRLPSVALVVSPHSSRKITSISDLKGANVGVTAPGSSTDFFLKYLLVKHGMAASDAHTLAVGGDASAVAAMQQGKVDAAVMVDPSISLLQKRAGELRILADARTSAGVKQEFGVDSYPGSVFYASQDWLAHNGDTSRKLAKAVVRALQWIHQHSATEIAQAMPAEYAGGDPGVYVTAIDRAKESFSADGVMPADGAKAAYTVLSEFNSEVAKAKIDLSSTYSNDYLPAR
ncbi:ABC transporter substrate-binding protein [Kutzneria buriramensis]|uniref:NitT/TauT family transport system substrate-binding protein n=1 Tax=Kutzneria buriramensis TaxID=1045776 RepID=A0A3E0GV02_9PSEU|nr:ABC transporter substrate-binding protein [Kutzneria buriramensis]REH28584.1 NitT/TauT family transport system substrate-binding protein [Kutzneria buriramensis]